MLWLALFLPELGFDLLVRRGHPQSRPAALLSGEGGIPRLEEVNAAAARRGLAPGQSLAHAYALVPKLIVFRREPQAEQAALQRLALCASAFSSRVLLAAQVVLLEIGGSLRLFGGLEALEARLRAELKPLGLSFREGIAPHPEAALFLARAGGGRILEQERLKAALAPLSLAHAPLPAELLGRLARLGLDRLGRLLKLPRAALSERFGAELVLWLERLLGERSSAYPSFRPPERFEADLELPQPAGSAPELGFALARLCRELAACLAARRLGVSRFRLRLQGRRMLQEAQVALRSPSAAGERLSAAAEAALSRLRLAEPVLRLGLEAEDFLPLAPVQETLWGTAREAREGRLTELIERLERRLGEAALYRLGLAADHRPERALRRLPPLPEPEAPRFPLPAAERPCWLLPEPKPVRLSDYELITGPERIESGWWDGEDIRRDYHLARDREGRRCWLFRDARGWFLHGYFA